MSSSFGNRLKVTLFGESHGPAIGVTLEGLPSGISLDVEKIQQFLQRRKPKKDGTTTTRQEMDIPHFLSGLQEEKTTGAPLTALFYNQDILPQHYENIALVPRPGHGDFTAWLTSKTGTIPSGGGHFSGRLTAPLCLAGAIAKQLLQTKHITIGGHISSLHTIQDDSFDPVHISAKLLQELGEKEFPALNAQVAQAMKTAILIAKEKGDSIGGVITCAAIHLPGGLGSPLANGIENKLAGNMFTIPGVRGISFGTGFQSTQLYGSEHNDPFYVEEDTVKTKTNHHGGILGGITTGMPLLVHVAMKPTPSISRPQLSVNLLTKEPVTLSIKGRHDPCIVLRALPAVESVVALTLLDALLEDTTF